MADAVLLVAWIDFLDPWSWVVTNRLEKLADRYGERIELEWRGFMRYPQKEQRDLTAWRASTKDWLEPATAEPGLTFSLWATSNPPPTHSAPPIVAALVAADVDPDRAPDYWQALFQAHFEENRTISDTGTLIALSRQVGIDDDAFAMAFRGRYAEYVKQVIDDHNEGLRRGISDTPAVVVADEFLVRGTPTLDQLSDLVDQVLVSQGEEPPPRPDAGAAEQPAASSAEPSNTEPPAEPPLAEPAAAEQPGEPAAEPAADEQPAEPTGEPSASDPAAAAQPGELDGDEQPAEQPAGAKSD